MITKTELVNQLRRGRLGAGDHVLFHSSLRKVGPIDGGADALLDALLEVVDHWLGTFHSATRLAG